MGKRLLAPRRRARPPGAAWALAALVLALALRGAAAVDCTYSDVP